MRIFIDNEIYDFFTFIPKEINQIFDGCGKVSKIG